MALSDTIASFNQLAADLPLLEQVIALIQAGTVSLTTDGQGNYWANYKQDTNEDGVLTPCKAYLSVAGLAQAQTAITTFAAFVQAATMLQMSSGSGQSTPTPIGG